MTLNQKIFKEYDIRGIYPEEINEESAYKIGRAFVKYLQKTQKSQEALKILVGRDLRMSSESLQKSFMSGVAKEGALVINLGLVTTPMLDFAVPFLKVDGGAMITASHNPQFYNGIKLNQKNGSAIGGEDNQKIYKLAKSRKYEEKIMASFRKEDITDTYLEVLSLTFNQGEKIEAQIDPGEGSAKLFTHDLMNIFGIDDKGAHPKFFASFDYDADRINIKNAEGEFLRGDVLGAIIADYLLKPGDILVHDLLASKYIDEYFNQKGIKTITSRVGHYNIKKVMRQNNANFGMEMTGHYFFKDFNYNEVPFLVLRYLVEILNKSPQSTLKELANRLTQYHHSGILSFNVKAPEKIIKKLEKEYKNGKQTKLDGLKVEYEDWWFNVRSSKTEPLLRLAVEANTEELMEAKKQELTSKIN